MEIGGLPDVFTVAKLAQSVRRAQGGRRAPHGPTLFRMAGLVTGSLLSALHA
jgi:hypothetical protein